MTTYYFISNDFSMNECEYNKCVTKFFFGVFFFKWQIDMTTDSVYTLELLNSYLLKYHQHFGMPHKLICNFFPRNKKIYGNLSAFRFPPFM